MEVSIWYFPPTGEYRFYAPGNGPGQDEGWEQHGSATLSVANAPEVEWPRRNPETEEVEPRPES